MIDAISFMCIGFDISAILYYQGRYERFFKLGFLTGAVFCTLGLIIR